MSANVSSSSDQNVTKVLVWSMPRTLGTAFVKCMSYVEGIQIFNEPFVCAYHFGPESIPKSNEESEKFVSLANAGNVDLPNAFDDNICTFAWVKQELEADYPGKKILLVKDQAFCLQNRYDLIPSGFHHAFLIRHPYRVIPSLKNMYVTLFRMDNETTSMSDILQQYVGENSYANQLNLLKYVKENVDPKCFVFDADDLQRIPDVTVRKFCEKVGIHYKDDLLKWPAGRDIIKSWKTNRISIQGNLLENVGGYYDTALMSTKFAPLKVLPKREDLQPDVRKVADESMPYYEQMRKMCI